MTGSATSMPSMISAARQARRNASRCSSRGLQHSAPRIQDVGVLRAPFPVTLADEPVRLLQGRSDLLAVGAHRVARGGVLRKPRRQARAQVELDARGRGADAGQLRLGGRHPVPVAVPQRHGHAHVGERLPPDRRRSRIEQLAVVARPGPHDQVGARLLPRARQLRLGPRGGRRGQLPLRAAVQQRLPGRCRARRAAERLPGRRPAACPPAPGDRPPGPAGAAPRTARGAPARRRGAPGRRRRRPRARPPGPGRRCWRAAGRWPPPPPRAPPAPRAAQRAARRSALPGSADAPWSARPGASRRRRPAPRRLRGREPRGRRRAGR